MRNKLLLLIGLIILFTIPCDAVLKEKNLGNTLSILRSELTTYHKEQEKQSATLKQQNELVKNSILAVLAKSNQNALMLYSQKPDYVFDLAYACHEATDQFKNFQKNAKPFRNVIDQMDAEVSRYDSLIITLQTMPTSALSDREKIDRNVCLTLAINIRRTLDERKATLGEYIKYYDFTEDRLKTLNDYANKSYGQIQNNIFSNGGDNYFVIVSRFGAYMSQTAETVNEKYQSSASSKTKSQWDSRMIIGLFVVIFFYGVIAVVVNIVCLRYLMPKKFRTKQFMAKRPCIIFATTAVTFAIIVGIIKNTVNQNFIAMACNLLVEYSWLLAVILISLLLRVDGKRIRNAFKIYAPLIVIGFIVITFRIILIPSNLVSLIFPPILLVCFIWQWKVIRKHNEKIPRSDVSFTYISLAIFVISVVMSWTGYTLMCVQVLIWWVMQLTCILTINCMSVWLHKYGDKHKMLDKPVTKNWFYYFLDKVIIPLLAISSVLVSIYWAADVFNLSEYTVTIFTKHFIDAEDFTLSLAALVTVVSLWFVFSYISKLSISLMQLQFDKGDAQKAASKKVMGKNVINILVWGAWLLISLGIMHVSSTWLVVISGGLSTGVGFASKDIIENFYYGISLMAGRIKIGDWIECDGTRGKVASISYTSTMIEAIDGSIIAFQNSQLFTKNYKNLTRNHGYALSLIPFGVAYGSDVRVVCKLVEDAVKNLDNPYLEKSKGITARFVEFGDSSIDFKLVCWIAVAQQAVVESVIRELIYDVLNKNNIEIPFPQRDLHVRSIEGGNLAPLS